MSNIKQVIIVRSDLKMGKGKIASQVAHASIAAYNLVLENQKKLALEWLNQGMPKIVLKVKDEKELLEIYNNAKKAGLIAVIITDAGKTQILEGSKTAVAIGPAKSEDVDKITLQLKLL
jgi:PTH2 family peptidyl-tRNA hydrolase